MSAKHGAGLLLAGLLVGLGVLSCLPVLTGAPCSSDANCPLTQHCENGTCEEGRGATGGGDGAAVRSAEQRCDDGLDDDGDGAPDCADADCQGLVCRAAAGSCDLAERCLAGVCPPDEAQDAGVTCRAAVGECDLLERCTGSLQCPADLTRCPQGQYCEASGCVAQRALGAPCTADLQCLSAHCVDGVCCDTRCEGACESCGSGACTVRDAGARGEPACAPFVCDGAASTCPGGCLDSSQCVSTAYCTAAGTCGPRLQTGTPCTTGAECGAGFCVDGLCCEGACTGACDVCDAPEAPGRCIPAPAGAPGAPSCSPAVCGGSSPVCPSGCTSDLQCAEGFSCGPGRTCVAQRRDGATCSTDDQCLSAHCVDGVCCHTACSGSCDVCNVTAGTCTTARAGTVGRPSCSGYLCNGTQVSCPTRCSGSADCGNGYHCVGGACMSNGGNGAACTSGSQCTSGNCVGGVCCNSTCTGACDGCETGTCLPLSAGAAGSPTCAPYVCNGTGTACPSACSSDAQCVEGRSCQAGRCVERLANGSACTSSSLCNSGHCVDGVCCNSGCGGACDACDVTGAVGTCRAATGPGEPSCAPYLCTGANPACPSACANDAQCAANHYCSASGECRARRANGASCTGPTWCTSGACVEGVCCDSACAGACDTCGGGTCRPRAAGAPGTPSCAPYVCNGSSASCPTGCGENDDCAAGTTCSAGVCTALLGLGAACTSAGQCGSGNCVDGVCCDSACRGACVSCALGGAEGTCSPRPAGTDPENECTASCDGAGACAQTCSPPGSCPAACGDNAFCTASGACGPTLLAGESCTTGCQCASGRCTTFFRDVDGDGFGQTGAGEQRCGVAPPMGFVTLGTDCADTDARVHPGATEAPGDEVDSNCDGEELCFRDEDSDGFRVDATMESRDNLTCGDAREARASVPAGDCCDRDADVHPGQAAYFERERECGGARYDYDCDGQQTARWTQVSDGGSACVGVGGVTCVELPGVGWLGSVPECGRREDFRECAVSAEACTTSTVERTQACR